MYLCALEHFGHVIVWIQAKTETIIQIVIYALIKTRNKELADKCEKINRSLVYT